MNLKNIVSGWWNVVKEHTVGLKTSVQQQVDIRRSICDTCSVNINGVCSAAKSDKHVYTGEETFGCSCPLIAKTTAPDSECPLGKWSEMLNEDSWKLLFAISEYNKLHLGEIGFKSFRGNCTLYNNFEGFFVSANGLIVLPYLKVLELALDNKLLTVTVFGRECIEATPGRFTADDSLITALQTMQVKNNHVLVVWIPLNFYPKISRQELSRTLDIFRQDVFRKTNKQIFFITTTTNDIDEMKEGLSSYNFLYELSNLPI